MNAVSQAQFNLMKEAAQGIRKVARLTIQQAAAYIRGQSPKGLPKRSKGKKGSFKKDNTTNKKK